MTSAQIYSSRAAAVRAARSACKRVLGHGYQAHEGCDYEIHPASVSEVDGLRFKRWYMAGTYEGPSFFILRGPAADIT